MQSRPPPSAIDGHYSGRRSSSPPRSIKAHPRALRPPHHSPALPHPLLTTTFARESRHRAIAGRPKLLVVGEHPLGLLASSIASRSARTRISCPGPLFSPPDQGRNHTLRASPRSHLQVADARELRRPIVANEPLVRSASSFSSSWSKPHSKQSPVARDRANSGDAPASRRRLRPSAASCRSRATPAVHRETDAPD
jgi:hypothetical protein